MQGLDILADQTEDPNFGAIIDAIAQDVESGETFSDALRKYPKAFPDLYVSMVRSGEASRTNRSRGTRPTNRNRSAGR